MDDYASTEGSSLSFTRREETGRLSPTLNNFTMYAFSSTRWWRCYMQPLAPPRSRSWDKSSRLRTLRQVLAKRTRHAQLAHRQSRERKECAGKCALWLHALLPYLGDLPFVSKHVGVRYERLDMSVTSHACRIYEETSRTFHGVLLPSLQSL